MGPQKKMTDDTSSLADLPGGNDHDCDYDPTGVRESHGSVQAIAASGGPGRTHHMLENPVEVSRWAGGIDPEKANPVGM